MATATNEIQEIQKILREFFGTRKSREIAVELYDIMHGEKQYFYNEKAFFVHKTARRLVLTMESSIKIHVQEILRFYHLGEDELQECLELVMLEHWKEKIAEYETIAIPASNSTIYTELMMHKARNDKEETFMNNLEEAIASSTGEFNVFVNDPSINSDGELDSFHFEYFL